MSIKNNLLLSDKYVRTLHILAIDIIALKHACNVTVFNLASHITAHNIMTELLKDLDCIAWIINHSEFQQK